MGREAERELARRGIPLYFTTKRSIIKEMVYRAMRLASALRTGGLQVLEVDPYASKVCLFGRQIPSNMKREDPVFSQQRLTDLIDGVARRVDEPDHDLCDALIAAQTAYLHTPR